MKLYKDKGLYVLECDEPTAIRAINYIWSWDIVFVVSNRNGVVRLRFDEMDVLKAEDLEAYLKT